MNSENSQIEPASSSGRMTNIGLRCALCIWLMFSASSLNAGPTGHNVITGDVTVEVVGDNTIIRNSDGSIIEWESFGISSGEIAEFLQTNSGSRVLNRVVGNLGTEINGSLRSNGHVYLIDPNGIAVGTSGVIDTNGIVLSTLDISNSDFSSGQLDFGGGGGSVVNDGRIVSDSNVILMGSDVENAGSISANGYVLLAAGSDVFVTGTLQDGINVQTAGPGSVTNSNGATIDATIAALVGSNASNLADESATQIIVDETGSILFTANGNNPSDGDDDGDESAPGEGDGDDQKPGDDEDDDSSSDNEEEDEDTGEDSDSGNDGDDNKEGDADESADTTGPTNGNDSSNPGNNPDSSNDEATDSDDSKVVDDANPPEDRVVVTEEEDVTEGNPGCCGKSQYKQRDNGIRR